MVKRVLNPFLLTVLAVGLLSILAKTLGPLTFLIGFGAGALGASTLAFSSSLKIPLDRYFYPVQAFGVVTAVLAFLFRSHSLAWGFGAVAIFCLAAAWTRVLQTAPGSLTWLISTSAGLAFGPLLGFLVKVPIATAVAKNERAATAANFLLNAELQDRASVFPTALLGLALVVALLHVTLVNRRAGPLLAGTFLTGLGFSGLLVMTLDILSPERALLAFGVAGFLGVLRAVRRKSDTLAPNLTPVLIRTVIFAIVGFYFIERIREGGTDPVIWPLMIVTGIPIYWSTQALASQVRLMKPGGDRASATILAVHFMGLFLGAVTVKVASVLLGSMPAVAVAAGFYLVAALVFSEERFWPFAKTLLSQPG